MNDLDRRVNREIANYSGAPVLIFPAVNSLETQVPNQILAFFERTFECEYGKDNRRLVTAIP